MRCLTSREHTRSSGGSTRPRRTSTRRFCGWKEVKIPCTPFPICGDPISPICQEFYVRNRILFSAEANQPHGARELRAARSSCLLLASQVPPAHPTYPPLILPHPCPPPLPPRLSPTPNLDATLPPYPTALPHRPTPPPYPTPPPSQGEKIGNERSQWAAYQRVNQAFADTVASVAREGDLVN